MVESDRHFFIRQEAAKRIRDRNRLFDFEDDRHVGQILVRYLTRREDVTYLERLSRSSRHVEVRSAAQVQLARLWRRLDAPANAADASAPKAPSDKRLWSRPCLCAAADGARTASTPPSPASILPRARDGSGHERRAREGRSRRQPARLGGALHRRADLVGRRDQRTRELLSTTRRELLGRHPRLVLFEVTQDAHVSLNLEVGPRLPSDSARAVGAWMTAYRKAARQWRRR